MNATEFDKMISAGLKGALKSKAIQTIHEKIQELENELYETLTKAKEEENTCDLEEKEDFKPVATVTEHLTDDKSMCVRITELAELGIDPEDLKAVKAKCPNFDEFEGQLFSFRSMDGRFLLEVKTNAKS